MRTQNQLDYARLLADPRWTAKRERILSRDGYTCQACDRHVEPLNVHHKVYEAWLAPWEYPDEYLITYCGPCHCKWHDEHPMNGGYSVLVKCHVCRRNVANAEAYGWGDGLTWCEACANRHEEGRTI